MVYCTIRLTPKARLQLSPPKLSTVHPQSTILGFESSPAERPDQPAGRDYEEGFVGEHTNNKHFVDFV